MSKYQKALDRLKERPKDFTWKELQTIMNHLGYQDKKGAGSRRKSINPKSNVIISLHQPHPKPHMKIYAHDIIIEHLQEEGLI